MNQTRIYRITYAALIAAVYAALTMATSFMSYGSLQFRIAEALCILPFFVPFTTWGLFLGCLISNLLSQYGILDLVFGSLATLLSCLASAAIGRSGNWRSWPRCITVCLMPVLWNAIFVGGVIAFAGAPYSLPVMLMLFPLYALSVAFGEAVVMFAIGLPLLRILPEKAFFRLLCEKLGTAG